jgi:hypothetical protein
MSQTKSVIVKTKTLTATYYKTSEGLLMDNAGDLTVIFGEDGMCGATSLEAGLRLINWDKDAETTVESISWI